MWSPKGHCRQRYKFKASYFPWCQYWQEASWRQDSEFTTKFPTTFFSVKSRWTWEERETMWIFWPKTLRIPSIVVLRLISYRSPRAPWCSSGTQGRTCPSGRSCSCPLGNRTSRFAERENINDWKWKQYWNESESEIFKLPVTSRFAETENSFEFWVLRGSGLLWLKKTVVIS